MKRPMLRLERRTALRAGRCVGARGPVGARAPRSALIFIDPLGNAVMVPIHGLIGVVRFAVVISTLPGTHTKSVIRSDYYFSPRYVSLTMVAQARIVQTKVHTSRTMRRYFVTPGAGLRHLCWFISFEDGSGALNSGGLLHCSRGGPI